MTRNASSDPSWNAARRCAIGAWLAALLASGCPVGEPIVPPPPPVDDSPEVSMDDSVPPVPHSATSCSTDCVRCHATGLNGAPPQAHPDRTECLLCHIVVNSTDQ